jgi:hypothetical protein
MPVGIEGSTFRFFGPLPVPAGVEGALCALPKAFALVSIRLYISHALISGDE